MAQKAKSTSKEPASAYQPSARAIPSAEHEPTYSASDLVDPIEYEVITRNARIHRKTVNALTLKS